jgi:hypothetical protein
MKEQGTGEGITQASLSKKIASLWKDEDKAVKRRFGMEAEVRKIEHGNQFPGMRVGQLLWPEPKLIFRRKGWKFRPRKKSKKEAEEDQDSSTPKSSQSGTSRKKTFVNGAARCRPKKRRASTVPLHSTPSPPLSIVFLDEAESVLGPCPPTLLSSFDTLMLSEALDIALPPGRRPSLTPEMTSIWTLDQQYWPSPSPSNHQHAQFANAISSYHHHQTSLAPAPPPVDYRSESTAINWNFGVPEMSITMNEEVMQDGPRYLSMDPPHPWNWSPRDDPARDLFQGYSFP